MKFSCKQTMYACFGGYIVSAIVNNFVPLLLVTFSKEFGFSIIQLGILIGLNFAIQMIVDFLGAKYIDLLGYRKSAILSQVLASLGLIMLGILPYIFKNTFIAVIVSLLFYAVGSGIIEVLVSPIIQALPSDSKQSNMGLLHSFYCWGSVLVILLSTIYFKFIGIQAWRWLSIIWASVPIFVGIMFCFVPIYELSSDNCTARVGDIVKNRIFWMLLIIMLCAGASEVSMSQWVSMFAEEELHVTKAVGDVLGPCMFAVSMGISRVIYSKMNIKKSILSFIFYSSVLCIISYFLACLAQNSILSLLGCALCGFSVGIFWPGTLSISADIYPIGGTTMFGLLALGGDAGCFMGPELVSFISKLSDDRIRIGLMYASIFPMIILILSARMYFLFRKNTEKNNISLS